MVQHLSNERKHHNDQKLKNEFHFFTTANQPANVANIIEYDASIRR